MHAFVPSLRQFLPYMTPITLKSICEEHPELDEIFSDRTRTVLVFTPSGVKDSGSCLGARFTLAGNLTHELGIDWLGKTGFPLQGHTPAHLLQNEAAKNVIREKCGSDIYYILGKKSIRVPRTFIYKGPTDHRFVRGANQYFVEYLRVRYNIRETYHVMSQWVENYVNFCDITTRDRETGEEIPFKEYLTKYHAPPEEVYRRTPPKILVPLRGMVELCTIAKAAADPDFLGQECVNAGCIFENDEARVVKIDPGLIFSFRSEMNQTWQLLQTNPGDPRLKLIQAAPDNFYLDLNHFSPTQKTTFFLTLLHLLRFRDNTNKNKKNVLFYLIFRNGNFNREGLEELFSRDDAITLKNNFQDYLGHIRSIYNEELIDFERAHLELILCMQALDTCDQLSLVTPRGDDTLHIRHICTPLTHLLRLDPKGECVSAESIPLGEIFQPREGRTVSKVIIKGEAGTGKSTACQKLFYDGIFDKRATYWIPLNQCNALMGRGGILAGEQDSQTWLARVIAFLVLERPYFEDLILTQIREQSHEIVILFDGLDEATSLVEEMVIRLFRAPTLNILITARPEKVSDSLIKQADLTLSTRRISDDQVVPFAAQFFQKNERVSREDAERLAQDFFSELRSKPNLLQLSQTSMILQMLCALWEEGGRFPETRTQVYEKMFDCILRYQNSRGERGFQRPTVVTKTELVHSLSDLSLRFIDQRELLLVACETEEDHLRLQQQLASGLIQIMGEGPTRSCRFIHKTFAEFILAQKIFFSSADEQYTLVQEYRNNPKFSLVLIFLAGLIFNGLGVEASKVFFGWLSAEGANRTGMMSVELLLQCLNECPNEELREWVVRTFAIDQKLLAGWDDRKIYEVERIFKASPYLERIVGSCWEILARRIRNNNTKNIAIAVSNFIRNTPQECRLDSIKTVAEAFRDLRITDLVMQNDVVECLQMNCCFDVPIEIRALLTRPSLEAIRRIDYHRKEESYLEWIVSLVKLLRFVPPEEIGSLIPIMLMVRDPIEKGEVDHHFREEMEYIPANNIRYIVGALFNALIDPDPEKRTYALERLKSIPSHWIYRNTDETLVVHDLSSREEILRHAAFDVLGLAPPSHPYQVSLILDSLMRFEIVNGTNRNMFEQVVRKFPRKLIVECIPKVLKALDHKEKKSSALFMYEKICQWTPPKQVSRCIKKVENIAFNIHSTQVVECAASALSQLCCIAERREVAGLIDRLLEMIDLRCQLSPSKDSIDRHIFVIQLLTELSSTAARLDLPLSVDYILTSLKNSDEGVYQAAGVAMKKVAAHVSQEDFYRLFNEMRRLLWDPTRAEVGLEAFSSICTRGITYGIDPPFSDLIHFFREEEFISHHYLTYTVIQNMLSAVSPEQLLPFIRELLREENASNNAKAAYLMILKTIAEANSRLLIDPIEESFRSDHDEVRKFTLEVVIIVYGILSTNAQRVEANRRDSFIYSGIDLIEYQPFKLRCVALTCQALRDRSEAVRWAAVKVCEANTEILSEMAEGDREVLIEHVLRGLSNPVLRGDLFYLLRDLCAQVPATYHPQFIDAIIETEDQFGIKHLTDHKIFWALARIPWAILLNCLPVTVHGQKLLERMVYKANDNRSPLFVRSIETERYLCVIDINGEELRQVITEEQERILYQT